MNMYAWVDVFLVQPDPLLCSLLAILAAFLMGFARSGIGAGGFVVSPLMVLALGSSVGIAIVAALMLPAALTSYWQHRSDAEPELSRPLIPAALVGTVLGGWILWMLVSSGEIKLIDRRLELVVAGMSLFYVMLVSFRDAVAKRFNSLSYPTPASLFFMGTGVGISQTVANSGSPLMTVYFHCHHIGKEKFVGAQSIFLVVQNTLKIVPLVLLGMLHLGNAKAAVLLFPLTMFGSWLGHRFYKRASENMFFGFYVLLLILGFAASVLLLTGRAQVFGLA